MSYALTRLEDGNGKIYDMLPKQNNAPSSFPFTWREGVRVPLKGVDVPTIGYQHAVEGINEWYQTSPVEEILNDTGDQIKFRTKSGSIYLWERF